MEKGNSKRHKNGTEVSDKGNNGDYQHKNGTEKLPTIKVRYRGDYLDKLGKGCVNLTVHLDKKKMTFNTGVKVEPKYWDMDNERVRASHNQSNDFNLIINTSKAKLNNIFVKYRLQDKILTFEIIKDEYERPNLGFDYLEWLEKAIEERRGEVTHSTIKQFRAHRAKMKDFQEKVAFAELSENFFSNFHRYLKVTLKNQSNTRWNTLKTHRTFMNIAIRKGIMTHNPLDKMPVKRGQTDRIFLDEAELKRLVALYRSNFLPDNYQRVLRHFLFSCFTGLRISDLQRVKMEDIISNMLMVVPLKTKNSSGNTIRIPLSHTALELIKDESPFRVKGLIFNTYSEQRMRLYLKDVIKHAKITKDVNFHSSRHTFATLFLKKTNNIAALQKLLGHQNINQTMVYAHIITDDLEREIDVFDNF